MNLIRYLLVRLRGQFIGQDLYGNKYYQDNRTRDYGKYRRYVFYQGDVEASKIPPRWHAWLHYVVDKPPPTEEPLYDWEKPHERNLTGTKFAYKPSRWSQEESKKSHSGYQAWEPEK